MITAKGGKKSQTRGVGNFRRGAVSNFKIVWVGPFEKVMFEQRLEGCEEELVILMPGGDHFRQREHPLRKP